MVFRSPGAFAVLAALLILAGCGSELESSASGAAVSPSAPPRSPTQRFHLEKFATLATGFFVNANRVIYVELPEEAKRGATGLIRGLPLTFEGKPLFFETLPLTHDGRQFVGSGILKGERDDAQLLVKIADRGVNPFGERELRIFMGVGRPGSSSSHEGIYERLNVHSAGRRWGFETRAAAAAYLSQLHPGKKDCYLSRQNGARLYLKALKSAVAYQDAGCVTGLFSQMSRTSRKTAARELVRMYEENPIIAPMYFTLNDYLTQEDFLELHFLDRVLLQESAPVRTVESRLEGATAPQSISLEDSRRELIDTLLSVDLKLSDRVAFVKGFIHADSDYAAKKLVDALDRSFGGGRTPRSPDFLVELARAVRQGDVAEAAGKLQVLLRAGWNVPAADPVFSQLVIQSGNLNFFNGAVQAGAPVKEVPDFLALAEAEYRRLMLAFEQETDLLQRERIAYRALNQSRILERLKKL